MKKLRASEIYRGPGITVTAIESIELHPISTTNGCQVYGSISPYALIVQTPEIQYALDIAAQPISMDSLAELL